MRIRLGDYPRVMAGLDPAIQASVIENCAGFRNFSLDARIKSAHDGVLCDPSSVMLRMPPSPASGRRAPAHSTTLTAPFAALVVIEA
jgi:hypothetical protein